MNVQLVLNMFITAN